LPKLDSTQRRVADFVAPHLRPREFVKIVMPDVMEKRSWLWAVFQIVAAQRDRNQSHSLVMTNERLLAVSQTWDLWPKKITWDWPLGSVRVFRYIQRASRNHLSIYILDGPAFECTFGKWYDAEADELVDVLESTTHSAPLDSE
jgi:hypothetical protein